MYINFLFNMDKMVTEKLFFCTNIFIYLYIHNPECDMSVLYKLILLLCYINSFYTYFMHCIVSVLELSSLFSCKSYLSIKLYLVYVYIRDYFF